jgi:integrase
MQRLFKRGRVWYGWFYERGRRVVRTTKCRDRAAAERVARDWERDASDPDHAAARTATLSGALKHLLTRDEEEVKAGRRSADTTAFHKTKAGHLVRVFEVQPDGSRVPFPLAALRAHHVDDYISRRRGEEVADATIAKELVVLRKSLRLAIRAGMWRGRIEEVIPVAFSPEYEPRKRALDAGEVGKLLAQLLADQAARVAFIVATSACWRETELARREDVGEGLATVLLRGTKRKTRFRTVPIVSPAQRSLLEYAVEHASGKDGALFAPLAERPARPPRRMCCQRHRALQPERPAADLRLLAGGGRGAALPHRPGDGTQGHAHAGAGLRAADNGAAGGADGAGDGLAGFAKGPAGRAKPASCGLRKL